MQLSDIQPQYFPRLHYFARMLASEVFIIRDDVQFVRNHKYPDGTRDVSYQAHTPIYGLTGTQLLTVSVKKGSSLPICQTHVCDDRKWARKHVNMIRNYYRGAPNLRLLLPEIEAILAGRFATLADLDVATICWALGRMLGEPLRVPDELTVARVNQLLGARPAVPLQEIGLGSDYFDSESWTTSSASERIVSLCALTGASQYLGGRTALQAYLDVDLFRQNGIEVSIQEWRCPSYPQQAASSGAGKAGFIADLSILDLLMNVPAEAAASLLGCG